MNNSSLRRKRLSRNGLRAMALCAVCVPGITHAQSGGVAAARSRAPQPTNSCKQLSHTPSALVGTREGVALLKMQQELSSASANIMYSTDSGDARPDMRKFLILRQGVDSLARMYVRSLDSAPHAGARMKGDTNMRISVTRRDTAMGRVSLGSGEVRFMDSRGNVLSEPARSEMEMMIRELEPQVKRVARGQPMAVEFTFSSAPRTSGYMGLTTSATNITSSINGEEISSFCEYPAVESVEPGSPAHKAGVITNDTLLAFDGRDLLQFDVNYSKLLIPGQTVRVRLRRTGHTLTLPVAIVKRPDQPKVGAQRITCDESEPRSLCEARITASMAARSGFMGSAIVSAGNREAGGAGGARGGVASVSRAPTMAAGSRSDAPQGAQSVAAGASSGAVGGGVMGMSRSPSLVPSAPVYWVSTMPGSNLATFGGAQFTLITEEFANNVGVEPGIRVMAVGASSPAGEAGLKAGDIVRQVNGVDVADFATFRKAVMSKLAERSASLLVSVPANSTASAEARSSQGTRTVVLRW